MHHMKQHHQQGHHHTAGRHFSIYYQALTSLHLRGGLFAILLFLSACQAEEPLADAYGNFETTPTMVGAEANGRLLSLDVEEGQRLIAGELVGLIDTLAIHLQMEKLLANKQALGQKIQEAEPEIKVLQKQKQNLIREQKRVEALLQDKAATPKQLDDIKGQIQVIDQQMAAVQRKTSLANRAILSERGPVDAQLNLLRDQKQRCFIYNPITGIVVNKLAEANEIKGFGSPLYRIASLDTMILRAYVTGSQLGQIALGTQVSVRIDGAAGHYQRLLWPNQLGGFASRVHSQDYPNKRRKSKSSIRHQGKSSQ